MSIVVVVVVCYQPLPDIQVDVLDLYGYGNNDLTDLSKTEMSMQVGGGNDFSSMISHTCITSALTLLQVAPCYSELHQDWQPSRGRVILHS